jgi:hypothetical protein
MPIQISDLTEATLTGSGAFDVLAIAVKQHVAGEYTAGRITGDEYAQVYLGALQSTLDRALEFLLQRDKINLELELLEIQKATAAIEQQRAENERDLVAAQILKINAEIQLVNAEVVKSAADKLRIDAQTDLLTQQGINAEVEKRLLEAQVCKTNAEFELLLKQLLKIVSETGLLEQKKVTETAQTNGAGVADDSVIGKQIGLYAAQTDGFKRDAEQKAASILTRSWEVQRTTDETGVLATEFNGLYDPNIGRVITKLLAGVDA